MNANPGHETVPSCAAHMGIVFRTLVLAAALLVVSAVPATAQRMGGVICGDRTSIAKSLLSNYEESLVATGLAEAGSVIEIFASPAGSWTMIITTPSGRSCYMASGESWENLPRLAGGKKI